MTRSAISPRSGPTTSGRSRSGFHTAPGLSTKAAAHPARSAPCTSQKAAAERRDGERRAKVLPERFVRPRDRREECRLQHRLEPLHADTRVAEHALEMWVEGTEVEERFVEVENEDPLHFSGEGGIRTH